MHKLWKIALIRSGWGVVMAVTGAYAFIADSSYLLSGGPLRSGQSPERRE